MNQVEVGKFNPDLWYKNLVRISHFPLFKKYQALIKLHDETLTSYIKDLQQITGQEAESTSSDGRIRKIVVAHIMGWEDFQTQVFQDEDPFARLKKQLNFQDYIDPDTGESHDFSNSQNDRQKSINDFNVFNAEKYKNWGWKDIKTRAIDTARRLRSCFPNEPSANRLNFLENSPAKTWKINQRFSITVPAGFYLWMVSLKHEAVEHRFDIALVS